jgi:hypothetical protein
LLHGTVANLGAATAHVTLGAASADVAGGAATGAFTLDGAPDQASDLLLVRDTDATGFAPSIDKMLIRRGLNLPSNAMIPVLDLSSSEAFATATAQATVVGLGADAAVIISDFITATRTTGTLSVNNDGATLSAFTVVPPSQLAASDVHRLIVAGESFDGNAIREAVAWFHTPSDQTVTLGPALTSPAISTVFAGAPQRLRAQLPSQSEYSASLFVEFDQDDGFFLHQDVVLSIAASYAGGTPSMWDLAIPDLSAAGYNAAWGLRSGIAADWFVAASNRTVLDESFQRDGATESLAARFGSGSALAAARTKRRVMVRGLRVVR